MLVGRSGPGLKLMVPTLTTLANSSSAIRADLGLPPSPHPTPHSYEHLHPRFLSLKGGRGDAHEKPTPVLYCYH